MRGSRSRRSRRRLRRARRRIRSVHRRDARSPVSTTPAGWPFVPAPPASGPYELFFSESGAGQVVRLSSDKPGEATPVITGFPDRQLGDGPAVRIGPLGLDFLTRTKLAVGTGGLRRRGPRPRLRAARRTAPLAYDQADHSVGPIADENSHDNRRRRLLRPRKTEMTRVVRHLRRRRRPGLDAQGRASTPTSSPTCSRSSPRAASPASRPRRRSSINPKPRVALPGRRPDGRRAASATADRRSTARRAARSALNFADGPATTSPAWPTARSGDLYAVDFA